MRSEDFCYRPENLGKTSKNENSLAVIDYFVFSSVLGKVKLIYHGMVYGLVYTMILIISK